MLPGDRENQHVAQPPEVVHGPHLHAIQPHILLNAIDPKDYPRLYSHVVIYVASSQSMKLRPAV
jgi:hypothetical protein